MFSHLSIHTEQIFSFNTGYEIKEDTYCLQDYGLFHTLNEAKAGCDADPTCGKINDEECDGTDFKLCKKGITLQPSSQGTCIYEKEGKTNSKRYPFERM